MSYDLALKFSHFHRYIELFDYLIQLVSELIQEFCFVTCVVHVMNETTVS